MWRNLLAQLLWEEKVTGSNPVIPILAPVAQMERGVSLRTRRILVQIQSGVLARGSILVVPL